MKNAKIGQTFIDDRGNYFYINDIVDIFTIHGKYTGKIHCFEEPEHALQSPSIILDCSEQYNTKVITIKSCDIDNMVRKNKPVKDIGKSIILKSED